MLFWLVIMAAFCAGATAAADDIVRRRIPNVVVLILVTCFVVACMISPGAFMPWWHHVVAAGCMLAVGYGLFIYGRVGAGDAKLAAACALWVGLNGLPSFLLIAALLGGITALFGLWRGWTTMPWAPAFTLAAMIVTCQVLWV